VSIPVLVVIIEIQKSNVQYLAHSLHLSALWLLRSLQLLLPENESLNLAARCLRQGSDELDLASIG
jgi:hypothetical protein